MITLHIPKNGTAPDILSEIGSARRIKDKTTRKATLAGLNKIAQAI